MTTQIIRVGDVVNTYHGRSAIECIEICEFGEKYGQQVEGFTIDHIDKVVIDLENGHWCRGNQIILG